MAAFQAFFYLFYIWGSVIKKQNKKEKEKTTSLQHWVVILFPKSRLVKTHATAKVTSVVSDSVQPQRQQPTRLPHPWDSQGKNTGVGCHFLLQCRKVKSESEAAQLCPTLRDPMDCSLPDSSVHGIFQARVLGCHCLLRILYIAQVYSNK